MVSNDSARLHKEAALQVAEMKKQLKGLSKNQLIHLVIQQVSIAIDHQNINKILMTQLEELKGDKKDEKVK